MTKVIKTQQIEIEEGNFSATYKESGEIMISLKRPGTSFSTIDFIHPREAELDALSVLVALLKQEIRKLKTSDA